jgi:hypothetical protein
LWFSWLFVFSARHSFCPPLPIMRAAMLRMRPLPTMSFTARAVPSLHQLNSGKPASNHGSLPPFTGRCFDMSHLEINHRARQLFVTLPIKQAEKRITTLYDFHRLGLDAQAIDHLLMAVPVNVRMR